MGQARVNRRRRKQMAMNNAHLSGPGIPRYKRFADASAKERRLARKKAKWLKTGSMYAGTV